MNDLDKLMLKLYITFDSKKKVKMWKKYIDQFSSGELNLVPMIAATSSAQENKEIVEYLCEKLLGNNITNEYIIDKKTKYYIRLSDSLLHQFKLLVFDKEIQLTKMAVISQNTFMILGNRANYSALIIDLENGTVHISTVSKEIYDNYYVEAKIKDSTIAFGMCNMIKNAADQWTESTPFVGKSVCNKLSNEASKELSSYGISLLLSAERMVVFKHGKKITYEQAIREIIETSPETNNLIEDTKLENFPEFVKAYSHSGLIDIFSKEYHKLKGSSNLVPYTGKSGGIEFVGAILLWKFANENLTANKLELNKYGPLIIGLADTLGFAFNNMDPLMWSDRMDVVINTSSDVLTYDEWSDVYRHLDTNFSDYIYEFDFTQAKSFEERRNIDRKFDSFSSIYDSLPNFKSVLDYYNNQGLGFKREIWFEIGN